MPRRGLDTADVVDAAAALIAAEGTGALSLRRVARELGVRAPSLYHHVGSLDGLHRALGLRAMAELGDALGSAVMGRSGDAALCALAHTFRAWVRAHPAMYAMTVSARPDDAEYAEASLRAAEPAIATLRASGLDHDASIHAARALRAALHGFVTLEQSGGFGLDVDVDASFAWLVTGLGRVVGADSGQEATVGPSGASAI